MKLRLIALTLALPLATRLDAQASAASAAPAPIDVTKLGVALSGRARTELSLSMPRTPNQPATTPLRISIDYGQPHARGRVVGVALGERLLEDGRVGRHPGDCLLADPAREVTVAEHRAIDVVEPEGLAGVVETLKTSCCRHGTRG